ncbi:hypothetical protein llap_1196 [Limosa lapponica baueri]|uniref:Uncharacterized protein n=1 Tax=Limosa lapponica baueri TaxID=1758121 RepID=A0A2I0UQY5_LIMLA|nr:hypothetical protein llap_1196 [Limosa lapponica baueri]
MTFGGPFRPGPIYESMNLTSPQINCTSITRLICCQQLDLKIQLGSKDNRSKTVTEIRGTMVLVNKLT